MLFGSAAHRNTGCARKENEPRIRREIKNPADYIIFKEFRSQEWQEFRSERI